MAHEVVPWDGGRKAVANDYVVVYVEQTKSQTPGKIRLRIRTYFYYAPYQYDQWHGATLDVYIDNSVKIMHADWEWARLSGSGYKTVYSPWFLSDEFDNTSLCNMHIVCRTQYNKPATETTHDFAIYPSESYLLTRTIGEHINELTYSIIDVHGINGDDRLNYTDPTAIVYEGDSYSWAAIPVNGYKIEPASGSGTVSGNITIAPTATPMATMHVKESAGWGMYSTYVRQNGVWLPHQANVRQNGTWETYT